MPLQNIFGFCPRKIDSRSRTDAQRRFKNPPAPIRSLRNRTMSTPRLAQRVEWIATVILRRSRALARDRLEGWKQAPRLRPSFETLGASP